MHNIVYLLFGMYTLVYKCLTWTHWHPMLAWTHWYPICGTHPLILVNTACLNQCMIQMQNYMWTSQEKISICYNRKIITKRWRKKVILFALLFRLNIHVEYACIPPPPSPKTDNCTIILVDWTYTQKEHIISYFLENENGI